MQIVIVGAGLAGLCTAIRLQKAGANVLILEASDRAGGRLKTDVIDGFTLDHGFQVAFTGYPALRDHCDIPSLQPQRFENGALHWDGTRLQEIHRDKPVVMALSTYLGLFDKLKVLKWTRQVSAMTLDQIREMPDQTAESFLREFGFSDAFLDRFARPFFGGIFLDRSLQTSLRQFAFVWKMLSEGETMIPKEGISAIIDQLMAQLAPETIRLNAKVAGLVENGVQLTTGEFIAADKVVVATEADGAETLSGISTPKGHRSSTCLYFEVPVPPVDRPILVLNATQSGRVNEVVPVSVVAPGFAPAGKHLVSATLLELASESDADLAEIVKKEVAGWFPSKRINEWRLLKVYRIRYAQMAQPAGVFDGLPNVRAGRPNTYFAGEFLENSSINGAMVAGFRCADAILEETA